jgi:hypothetical protein
MIAGIGPGAGKHGEEGSEDGEFAGRRGESMDSRERRGGSIDSRQKRSFLL